jgi:hypothetical protein
VVALKQAQGGQYRRLPSASKSVWILVLSPLHEAGREALDGPFRAFPSWFLRITCDRCGQQRVFSETHSAQGDMLIRDIIARMRHGWAAGQGRWSC